MQIKNSSLFILIFLMQVMQEIAIAGNNAKNISPLAEAKASHEVQSKKVRFQENKGQMVDMAGTPVPYVLFKTQAPGLDMYITEKGLTYVFLKAGEGKKARAMIR